MLALTARPESTVYPRAALMAQAATDEDRAREPAIAVYCDGLGAAYVRPELYSEEGE